jgi:hypothetical protein
MRTGAFGFTITPLGNGNLVVTNPHDNLVAPAGGAVYLLQGQTGALLGDLVGSTAGDLLGDADDPGGDGPPGPPPNGVVADGVLALTNGNYVVLSPRWNNNRGAATWGDGTVGITGIVDASNSLVGSNVNDDVGAVASSTALSNGNYVVGSPDWNGRGAATWADGTVGITGIVNAGNSLIGSNIGDRVGLGVAALSNGNYVVDSPYWNGGRGAATWADGTVGATGTVDASSSLTGSSPGDQVGLGRITTLNNGNYVVLSPNWNGNDGAATWGDGTVGVTGAVDAGNSLVGSNANDFLDASVTALSNGNYVVDSLFWNGRRGAATWGDGTIGISGTIDASNSLVGSNSLDSVGANGVTALRNGNYVVLSSNWNFNLGAATWGDGTIGITGTVDATNSLVGSNGNDRVGLYATALINGNFVVRSPYWGGDRGAATWADGTVGVTGTVGAGNSLVGTIASSDEVGSNVTALSNGNYVVGIPNWNGGRGAATWADGTVGITGTINAGNSLVGSSAGDRVAEGVTALKNGSYVVASPGWNGSRGAVTLGDGTIGITGTVDSSNSLVGSSTLDRVGSGNASLGIPGVTALFNGNYVVASPFWNGNRGAATWGDGTIGITGTVDPSNSLVGQSANDFVGLNGVTALFSGNYVVDSPNWNGNRGAATWGDGTVGDTGALDASNSLVGSNPNDQVGSNGVTALSNGNYVVASPNWNSNRGAATWGDGTVGITGEVNENNSLVG